MQCKKCGHDTNHKSGICAACSFDIKFKVGGAPLKGSAHLTSASRPSKATKSNQGTKGGTLALSPSYTNKKLKLFARAQISYLLSLAYSGNMPNLISRLHLLQRSLRSGDFLNAR